MPSAPPLGIVPEIPGRSHQLTLTRGERLVFFTDGLTESFNADRVPLDLAGVEKLLGDDFNRIVGGRRDARLLSGQCQDSRNVFLFVQQHGCDAVRPQLVSRAIRLAKQRCFVRRAGISIFHRYRQRARFQQRV